MSEARGRKADDSAEKGEPVYRPPHPHAVAVGEGIVTGAAVGAAGMGAAVIRAHRKEKAKYPTIQQRSAAAKKRRDKQAAKRLARARGGGGGLYVTPDAATRRDVSKRFRRN